MNTQELPLIKNEAYRVINPVFIIIVFCFSYFYSSAYQLGDQIFYRRLYLALSDASFAQIPYLQRFHTGSSEPLYGIISWVGAQLSVDKDVYFSVINAMLSFALLRFLQNNSAKTIYIVLTFFNYYLLVLFGAAERLKIAYLFLFISVNIDRRPLQYLYLISAILSHFQTLILIGSKALGAIPTKKFGWKIKRKSFTWMLIGLTISILLLIYLVSHFFSILLLKIGAYSNEYGLFAYLKIVLLILISLVFLKQRQEIFFVLSATAVAAGILGPDRVNMVAFSLFSYYVVKQKKTGNPIVLAIMTYFAVKGLIFVYGVFLNGTGY